MNTLSKNKHEKARDKYLPYIGQTINKLVINGLEWRRTDSIPLWCFVCRCKACGKETVIMAAHVINGNTKSCGCQKNISNPVALAKAQQVNSGRVDAAKAKQSKLPKCIWFALDHGQGIYRAAVCYKNKKYELGYSTSVKHLMLAVAQKKMVLGVWTKEQADAYLQTF